ncbi:MAG: hypothetical protein WDO72_16840 [Pseudomonadota bacterium]
MRLWLALLLGWITATCAHAQSADKKPLTAAQYRLMMDDLEYWRQQQTRYDRVWQRALELRPGRRNTPLRDLNISDGEVREVQVIAARFLPRALVNISPVVTECPCEEGPACTAQVYVLATGKGKTSGLQLSRMNEVWDVGVVQKWWLKREAIQRQNTGNVFLDDYLAQKARNDLLEEFPLCAGQPGVSKTEGKK